MKKINLILCIGAAALMATSCVEKSDKYQAMLSQRDSLLVVAQNYNQALDILNEVESGFNSISELENSIKSQVIGAEGQPSTKKQQLAGQINQIKGILEQNKTKIAELQTLLAQSGRKSNTLAKHLERLEAELLEKGSQAEVLQAELAKKNIKIEELSLKIEGLDTDVAKLNEVSAEQQKMISQQDADLNSIWYVVGTAKELKASQILSGNGLFRAKSVMDKNFDKSTFIRSDLRQVTAIPTDSKRPKLLSSHPEGSYEWIQDDNRAMTIRIIDPAKFWSISKYLVIQK